MIRVLSLSSKQLNNSPLCCQCYTFSQQDPEVLYVYFTTFQMILVGVLLVVYLVNYLSNSLR